MLFHPCRQTDNLVRVPGGPGLRVTPDRDAFAHRARHFQEKGPMDPFHAPADSRHYRRLSLNRGGMG